MAYKYLGSAMYKGLSTDLPSLTTAAPNAIFVATDNRQTYYYQSGVWTTEAAKGATSVADGGTITHGLGTTPTVVTVTPSTASEFVSVTARSATTFTVAIKKHDNSVGTTQTVYWRAEI